VTTRKPTEPTPCPHYVPPLHGYARVTLTAEIGPEHFLGDYEGEPVNVWVSGADALRVRRAIRDHGSAVYDSPGAYIHDARPEDLRAADPEHIPLSEEERGALSVLAFMKRTGVIHPADPA
jgi:hypothetical protein